MKKYKLIIGIACLLCALAGCGNSGERSENTEIKEQTDFPKKVVDQIGREVVLEKEPESIVSGYYISTSTIIALDQEDKIVGLENDADKRPVYGYAAPFLLEAPSLGTVKEFDLEECAVLDPDLVVIPTKLTGMIPSLESLGMTVLVVNPENEELLQEMILLLGDATGSRETAEALCQYMESKMDDMKAHLETEEKPEVYLAGNSSLLSTAGSLMYQNSLIENAGGINVAADLEDTYWAEVSYEQILAWNPEYIVLAADANYTVEDVLNDKNIAGCDAVKNKNVYQIPNQTEPLDSPVPGSLLGTLYVANVLHPDSYSEEKYEQTFKEFYEIFYQFEIEVEKND